MNEAKLALTRKWAGNVADALGKPLDAGIFNLVVALKLHGIHTTASCEGHTTWGLPSPWVDVESPKGAKLHQNLVDSFRKHPTRKHLTQTQLKNITSIRALNIHYAKKIIPLLELFYSKRRTSVTNRIIINFWSYNVARLQCQGLDVTAIKNTKAKQMDIHAYQKEFNDFAQFLLNL